MSKSSHQKLKLLYLYKILFEKTDELHTLTVPQMIAELENLGIKAEHKTIYDDIEALRLFGLDLVCRKTKTHDYYVGNRTFELPELKLLVDAVACSKFITEKKSNELIKKIESLASRNETKQLQRQVIVTNRAKAANEKIYYNVDMLHSAIAAEKQISFKYFDIGIDKKKHYRKGERIVSPYALTWDNEKYYLIAYYPKYNDISHFRVDRMESIIILTEDIDSPPVNFNTAEYSKKVFSMFGGEEQTVTMQFDNTLIGVVYDKFGKDVGVRKADENSFIISVKVAVRSSFYGWLFQFGKMATIISPDTVRLNYFKMAMEICEKIKEQENE